MTQVRISTESLLQVASQMNSWSERMKGIAADMKSRVNNIQDWNDPRAEQFKQQATMTAQQLLLHLDNFTRMANFLNRYAQMQVEAEREQRNRMNNI